MSPLSSSPVTFEEIKSVKDSDLKFENVENLTESLGEDGMSVMMDLDKVEAPVLADTDGTSKKISNSVSFCGGNVQESQDLGARTPIGVIGIENFKLENLSIPMHVKWAILRSRQKCAVYNTKPNL